MHTLIMSMLIAGYAIVAILLYWAIFPYRVLEYKDKVLPLKQTQLRPGDEITVHHRFCKYTDVELYGLVALEDGVILSLPPVVSRTLPGCYDRWGVVAKVPLFMRSKETARIHYTLSYKVNPIRTIKYELFTEPFSIVSSTVSAETK